MSERDSAFDEESSSGYDKLKQRARTHARDARAQTSERDLQRWWPVLPATAVVAGGAYLVLAQGTQAENAAPVLETPLEVSDAAPPAPPRVEVVQPLGNGTAVVAGPLADFHFGALDSPGRNTIALTRGAITALQQEGQPDRLLEIHVRGAVIETHSAIVSVSCCYRGNADVVVHEGSVVVRKSGEERTIEAGASWPEEVSRAPRAVLESAAVELRQWRRPPADDQDTDVAGGTGSDSQAERWRAARRLRVEGELRESLALFDSLAAEGDEVWAPLALFEVVRLNTAIAEFEAVIAKGEDFTKRFPDHELGPEVKRLMCNGQKATGVELTACPQ